MLQILLPSILHLIAYSGLISVVMTFLVLFHKPCSGWGYCDILSYCYIRHLSYCFCIAVNRICEAISRVDEDLKPRSEIHLGVGDSTKTCISGFACSSYVKSALAAGAEEIITMIQQPKWRCSNML